MMPTTSRAWFAVVMALTGLGGCAKHDDADGARATGEAAPTAAVARGPLKVAVAASLAPAFEELGKAFRADTGIAITVVPGASGKLAKQIAEGAPFDVFASADANWIDDVIAEDAALPATRVSYAFGRLVVWGQGEAPATLEGVADPQYVKIALANPEHAPYGRAAREALDKKGLWSKVESRVVYGSNVRQAFQFAETGNAELSFTALSLVINGSSGHYLVVDDALHAPLGQEAIVCKRSEQPAAARELLAFLSSDKGAAVLRKYGLLRAGEQL